MQFQLQLRGMLLVGRHKRTEVRFLLRQLSTLLQLVVVVLRDLQLRTRRLLRSPHDQLATRRGPSLCPARDRTVQSRQNLLGLQWLVSCSMALMWRVDPPDLSLRLRTSSHASSSPSPQLPPASPRSRDKQSAKDGDATPALPSAISTSHLAALASPRTTDQEHSNPCRGTCGPLRAHAVLDCTRDGTIISHQFNCQRQSRSYQTHITVLA